MIKLAVSGCMGRMGQRITHLALADKTFKISCLLENKAHPNATGSIDGIKVTTDSSTLKGCHVLIEFTTPDATMENLKNCVKYGVKMVIGTTGLDAKQIAEIKKASRKIPIIFSSNMSVGVNLVFKLLEITASKTGKSYTSTITEAHHIHKKDAPSGTAKTMAEIIEAASKQKVSNVKSIREGEIIGDHTTVFDSPEDTITIIHHAKGRDIFAKGSLVAAKFLSKKKNGLYNMKDVLGLNSIK